MQIEPHLDMEHLKMSNITDKNSDTFKLSLQSLMEKGANWETNFLLPCNKELYEILKDCLLALLAVRKHRSYSKVLDLIIENKNLKVQSNTDSALKIIKVVLTPSCRRTASRYAMVLRWALKNKIAPTALPAAIIEAGGIEKIRLSDSKVNEIEKTKKFAVRAQTQLPTVQAIATVKEKDAPAANSGDLVLFVGVMQDDGSVKIVQNVQASAAQKRDLFAKIGKQLEDQPAQVKPVPTSKDSVASKAASKAKAAPKRATRRSSSASAAKKAA